MRATALAAVFAALALAQPAGAASGGPKARSILVLELRGDPSVIDPATLATITSTVSVSVSKRRGLNVLTAQDVKNLVDVEAQKQMLGCAPGTESCLAEVANAMGAELVLSGDVGKLGASYVINLHLFDAAKARSVGRDNVVVADLAQLPQLLDASIAGLLTPITGQQGLTSKTGGFSIPTVDTNALKGGGLKAINMQAETALEHAMDMQDDPNAQPDVKRDAWCALTQVPGSNPYLGPAQKACDEWTQYVAQSAALERSIAADYDTLAGFLQLKRKTQQQRLEAIDAFLQGYSRLDNELVRNVQDARRKVAGGDDNVTLPDRPGATVAPDPTAPPATPEGPGLLDGCFDGVGCLAVNFDAPPHFGLVLGTHLSLADDVAKFDSYGPQLPPSLIMGTRIAWAFFEGGLNLDIDFLHGPVQSPSIDGNVNSFEDDYDDDGSSDDDFDGIIDDVDDDPEVSCVDIDDNADGIPDRCDPAEHTLGPGQTPNGKQERDAAFFFHAYMGLQTISVSVEDVTILRPSFGLDVYTDAFEKNDFGFYVANTIAVSNIVQLRTFVRAHLGGEVVVPSVQLGLEGSLDYLTLFDE
jgi:hypothetical protein